jgi:hypothetical protein
MAPDFCWWPGVHALLGRWIESPHSNHDLRCDFARNVIVKTYDISVAADTNSIVCERNSSRAFFICIIVRSINHDDGISLPFRDVVRRLQGSGSHQFMYNAMLVSTQCYIFLYVSVIVIVQNSERSKVGAVECHYGLLNYGTLGNVGVICKSSYQFDVW